jgi:hypothetical protein
MASKKSPRSDKGKRHRPVSEGERARAAARMALVRLVDVTLRCKHTVNGVVYGPGKTRVRKDIAEGLLEGDRNAAAADDRFFGNRAGIVGARGRVIPVPPDLFDHYLASAAPMDTIAGIARPEGV